MKRLTFLFLILLSISSSAQKAKVLSFVTGPDFLPLVDEKDPKGGFATELLRKALAEEGYDLKVTFRPWIRGREATKLGQYDGTFPYTKTDQREKDFLFSDAFYVTSARFFVLKNRFSTFDDLKGHSICIPLGYDDIRMKAIIEKMLFKVIRPPSLTSCFEMLHLGRVDGVGLAEEVGWSTIMQIFKSKSDFLALDGNLQDARYFVMVGKTHPQAKEIIRVLNKAIKRIQVKAPAIKPNQN